MAYIPPHTHTFTLPVASDAQAIAGDDDTTLMTPAKVDAYVRNSAVAGDIASVVQTAAADGIKKVAIAPLAAVVVSNTPYTATTFDGYAANIGDRIGFFGQSASANSGIYIFQGGGAAAVRAPDFAVGSTQYAGSTVQVVNGTARGGTLYRLTNTIVVGSNAPVFVLSNKIDNVSIKPAFGTYLPTLSEIADGLVGVKRFATTGNDISGLGANLGSLPYGTEVRIDPGVAWKSLPMNITTDGVTLRGGDQRSIIDAKEDFQPYLFKHTGSGMRGLFDVTLRGALGGEANASLVGTVVDGPRLIAKRVKVAGFRGGYDIYDTNASQITEGLIEDHKDFGIRLGVLKDDFPSGIVRNASECYFSDLEIYTHIADAASLSGSAIIWGPRASATYINEIRGGGHASTYLFDADDDPAGRTGHVFMAKCISGFARDAGWHFKGRQNLYIEMVGCSAAADMGAGIRVDGLSTSFRWIGGSVHRSRVGVQINNGDASSRYRFVGASIQSNTKRDNTTDLGYGVGVELNGGAGHLELNSTYIGDKADFPSGDALVRPKYAVVKRAAFTGKVTRNGGDWADNLTAETLVEGTNPFVNQNGDSSLGITSQGKLSVINQSGAFTPAIKAATTGDLTVSYASQTGVFEKIGDIVHVNITMTFTPTYTSASGGFSVTGLPFPGLAAPYESALQLVAHTAFTWPSSATQIVPKIGAGSTEIVLSGLKSGSAPVNTSITAFTSGTAYLLRIHGSYRTA